MQGNRVVDSGADAGPFQVVHHAVTFAECVPHIDGTRRETRRLVRKTNGFSARQKTIVFGCSFDGAGCSTSPNEPV